MILESDIYAHASIKEQKYATRKGIQIYVLIFALKDVIYLFRK